MKRILMLAAVSSLSCGGDVTAPDPDPVAGYTLAALGATSDTTTVAAVLRDHLAVIVTNGAGVPVPGVPVAFTATGLGAVANRSTYDAEPGNTHRSLTVTTGSDGIASPVWVIGLPAGDNFVTASLSETRWVAFVTFGRPGAPETIEKVTGDGQTVSSGTALLIRPTVSVLDAYRNPIAGVAVTFAVVSGGGSVTGSSPVTDGKGEARVGDWVAGASGVQRLSASVPGLPEVIFSATVLDWSHACGERVTIPHSIPVQLALDAASCIQPDGKSYDEVEIEIPEGGFRIRVTSADFDTEITLRGSHPVAFNDDFGGTRNSLINAILPAGRYTIRVVSKVPGELGKYAVVYSPETSEATGCHPMFVVPGSPETLQRTSAQSDCAGPLGGYDKFLVYLQQGVAVSVEVEDISYSDHYLLMRDASSTLVATGYAESVWWILKLSFVPLTDGYYSFEVGSPDDGSEYNLTVR
ncbi:MAG: Ig-like domain-containing protein [Gemmatimonadaceae bacterium]